MKPVILFLTLFSQFSSALTVSERESPHALFIDRNVVLLDSDGNEAAVKVGDSARSPLGIFVALTPKGSGQFSIAYCTATHLKGEFVALAAHCIPEAGPITTWLIFYAKDGKRQIVPVYQYIFKGEGHEDVAIARLHEEAIPMWDEADYRTYPFEKSPDSPDIAVSLWSYSPLVHFPKFQKRYPGRAGMVYQPNRCVASQLLPRIEARHKRLKRKTGEMLFGAKFNAKKHLFIDKCKNKIVQGNSGSLITHGNNFNFKLGILHFVLGDHETVWKQMVENGMANDPNTDLFYFGVDGKSEKIDQHIGSYSLGAGTLFEVIEKRNPAALPKN